MDLLPPFNTRGRLIERKTSSEEDVMSCARPRVGFLWSVQLPTLRWVPRQGSSDSGRVSTNVESSQRTIGHPSTLQNLGNMSTQVRGASVEDTALLVAVSLCRRGCTVEGHSSAEERAAWKDRGLGSGLLTAIERKAEIQTLNVSVSLDAVGFYEARGYERTSESTVELESEIAIRCVDMQKLLA